MTSQRSGTSSRKNRQHMNLYDAAVIGGGFKGMMAAYGLIKQGMSVCIIDKSRQLGGFMSPMQWQGTDIDKGPQYLDDVGEKHKLVLDDIMSDHEPLTSLNFSYGSFWNNTYTEGFALPDYRTLPKADKAPVLYETINQSANGEHAESIADFYSEDTAKTYSYINRWCNKFLQNDAENLSPLNRNFVTFLGRKLLLDNDLSLELKQLPLLDDIIAADKKTIDHGTYNLYPEGRNLGYFRQAFESKLNKIGIASYLDSEVARINSNGGTHTLSFSDDTVVQAKAIYCAATIECTEFMFLDSDQISSFISPVAQIFYLLEMNLDRDLPFYIMNYSDSSISRVTNFTVYANKSQSGQSILCVEVPTTTDSKIWNDPDAHYAQVCSEIEQMGIGVSGISEYQAFKIPSTYRAVLSGYENKLEQVCNTITDKHGDSVHIITPHLLTRASIMNDLTANDILQ